MRRKLSTRAASDPLALEGATSTGKQTSISRFASPFGRKKSVLAEAAPAAQAQQCDGGGAEAGAVWGAMEA